ncbi:MAG: hypothetical protein R3185_03035 [Candidatus Thermoplasmatota archaeon]|nr:hypothetical protein [Candidatus Thermoplasmatota archaeon]
MRGHWRRLHLPRALVLALVLLTAGLAGCLGGEEDSTPPTNESEADTPPPDTATVLPWGLAECQGVIAAIPVEAEAMADRLPENFTYQTPEEFGLPPDMRGDAVLGIEAFRCENGTTITSEVSPMVYASLFAPVHPADDVATDDPLQFVKWEVLIPDADRRELLVAAGVPAVNGSAELNTFTGLPAGGFALEITATMDGGTYTFRGTAPQPMEEFQAPSSFTEYTPTPEGLVLWQTETIAPDMHQGTGTVSLPAGSWASEVVGQEQTQAFLLTSGQATFHNATITLP